jgi:hypothetical protein
MDPLSIASATVGFVAFVLQVASTAKDFVQDTKGFPQEFVKLSRATKDFAIQVQRLSPSIQKIEQRYKVGGIVLLHYIADICVENQTDTLKRCTEVLDEINDLLNGFKGSFRDRTTWAFTKKKKAGEMLNQLEQCKSTLELAITNELLYNPSNPGGKINSLDCKWGKKAKRVVKNVKWQQKRGRKLSKNGLALRKIVIVRLF